MNMKPHHWVLTLLCGTLFATSSLAEEPPWYEIEIIIFTRDIQPASLNEAWPSNPGTHDFDHARPLQRVPTAEIQPLERAAEGGIDNLNSATHLNLLTTPGLADESTTLVQSSKLIEDSPAAGTTTLDPPELQLPIESQPPEPYALLAEEDFTLKTEFSRLQRSRSLKPEIHLAWRQPVTDKNSAQLLYLRTPFTEEKTGKEAMAEIAAEAAVDTEIFTGVVTLSETKPPSLEGTIRISIKRYLHVELDLIRHITPPSFAPYEQPFNDTLTEYPQTDNSYRMQANRRMRSNELHYIDHPLMGVLIRITPYELPKPMPVEPEAVEPKSQTGETAETGKTAILQQPDTTKSNIEIPAKAAE